MTATGLERRLSRLEALRPPVDQRSEEQVVASIRGLLAQARAAGIPAGDYMPLIERLPPEARAVVLAA